MIAIINPSKKINEILNAILSPKAKKLLAYINSNNSHKPDWHIAVQEFLKETGLSQFEEAPTISENPSDPSNKYTSTDISQPIKWAYRKLTAHKKALESIEAQLKVGGWDDKTLADLYKKRAKTEAKILLYKTALDHK